MGRRCQDVLHQHVKQLLFAVGVPLPLLVAAAKRAAADEGAGVQLELVWLEALVANKAAVALNIALGGTAAEVGHEVGMDLEAKEPEQGEGALGVCRGGGAAVEGADILVERLNADLHLGASQLAQLGERRHAQGLGAGLHHQAHHAVRGALVGALLPHELSPLAALPSSNTAPAGHRRAVKARPQLVVAGGALLHQLLAGSRLGGQLVFLARNTRLAVGRTQAIALAAALGRAGVEGGEEPLHKPDAVGFRVICPGAAQDDELHLVGDVAHLLQSEQAACHLQVGVEEAALGATASGLVGQVALGHAHVVGAVEAVAPAGPGLGDHGDGGNAAGRAPRLGLQRLEQALLHSLVDTPAGPALGLLLTHAQIEGQDALFRDMARDIRHAGVAGAAQPGDAGVVDVFSRLQQRAYAQNQLFHALGFYPMR